MVFEYPTPRRDESVVDDLHGTKISDPYRWMEDPDSEETKAFVDQQNVVSKPFIDSYPDKQKIHDRLKQLWDYPKYSCPSKRGSRYFYYHNSGLQNQSILYVQDSLEGEPRVFLDPNLLSEKGTTAIKSTAFSEDGSMFAYSLSEKGSDWSKMYFKDVATGKDLPDILENVKFSCISWTHDGKGIFYNRYHISGKGDGTDTDANINQKLYYHYIGTDQSEDVLCAELPEEPKWMLSAEVSDCGNYVLVAISHGCEHVNRLFYCNLSELKGTIKETGKLPLVKLIDNFDAEYEYITNEGTVFTFKTNLKSPRCKLINIDFEKPEMDHWSDLVQHHAEDVLEWATPINQNKLLLCYMHDVKNVLHLHMLEDGSRITTIPLDVGSVIQFSGKKKHDEFFFKFQSFLTPGIVYQCNLTQDPIKPKIFRKINLSGLNEALFETKQVFYESKDGTRVPMFIIHKKGIELNGSHPALLYGYGGFMIPLTPSFSISRIIFTLHFNGIVAVANIRGGGEYGESWHKGGMKETKQNCFDDFQYAAKYLETNGYTNADKLIIQGGSNGGLLVAACANQAPELFKCVIGHVGVMDMLRFHKFTIGHAWITDFGDPDDIEYFQHLVKYSPLHNIDEASGKNYPATLLLTADHDDRVVPSHSLKFIAELQQIMGKQKQQVNPLMIRVDTESGHGAGKPTSKMIEEVAEIFSFVALTCVLKWVE